MKHTIMLALFAAAAAVGCGGDDSDTPNTPTPTTPGQTTAALYDYAGTWIEHDERCEWSQSAGQYKLEVDVITRTAQGVYRRDDVDRFYANAQCSGTPLRSVTTSVEYLYVVGQGQLADGTRVDLMHETKLPGGPVTDKCVAFVQDGKLFDECNDANRDFPTQVDRHEWYVKL